MDPSHFQIQNHTATAMLLIERDFSCYDHFLDVNHLLNNHYCNTQIKNISNFKWVTGAQKVCLQMCIITVAATTTDTSTETYCKTTSWDM